MIKKSGGFTMVELIIAVGIMAVTGVFLVQVFLSASVVSQKARDTDSALYHAQAVIEEFKMSPESGGQTLYFGENWSLGAGEMYVLESSVTRQGDMSSISVTVTRREAYPMDEAQFTQLVQLTALKYGGVS